MRSLLTSLALLATASSSLLAQEWKPAEAPVMTRWAKEVSPDNVLPEYPRPQLVREKWQNLNGLWNYAIQPKDENKPDDFQGKILVPFAVESALSGVMKQVGEENKLWYQRTFSVPQEWRENEQRVLLHFGAVDWQSTVWINGKEVGEHEGGYDPFSLDITDALREGEEQELIVSVWDPSDKGPQPRGKQVANPHGIWYTPVTGIWQTVWIEPVASHSIAGIEIRPDVDGNKVDLTVICRGGELRSRFDLVWEIAEQSSGNRETSGSVTFVDEATSDGFTTRTFSIDITPNQRQLWTPDNPFLFNISLSLRESGRDYKDRVTSYFAMRKIEVAKDKEGINRLFLNGEPLFQFGPLDQGWWPDGLYTAPTDEALKFDIEMTKKLGFNMARKHVKVEPARWYYHCDKLGLLVWQDMPNGDAHVPPGGEDITRSEESEAIYREEWKAIVEALDNFPCIVVWVPFNEGWGQFKTNEILAWTKELDPTRIVGGPSGWQDRGEGDLHDMHMYPGPGMFPAQSDRVSVLGEFGGLGWPAEGHLWKQQDNWGYRTYQTQEKLIRNYKNLIVQIPPLIGEGLAAAIYTQTTDVEVEVNGLMTYDREVIKLPAEQIAEINRTVYGPPSKLVTVIPTSQQKGQTWKYTFDQPAEGWQEANLDDSNWKEGPGGFGTEGTPGATIGTTWNTPDVWLRKTVTLPEGLQQPALRLHHDENVQVFLNGKRIANRRGYVTDYILLPLDEEAKKALKAGENVIAVHCHQTGGGQYVDVGIVDLVPAKK